MEGFKNLVPQYALVRRNGGEKITVNTLFNITNCLHTENVQQICFETLSVPYHRAQTIISAFKVSHFQRRLNDTLLYQSISHKKLWFPAAFTKFSFICRSILYKNFWFPGESRRVDSWRHCWDQVWWQVTISLLTIPVQLYFGHCALCKYVLVLTQVQLQCLV